LHWVVGLAFFAIFLFHGIGKLSISKLHKSSIK
jgi:hypothetical protein